MATTTPIPVTDVSGQQVITLPATTQVYSAADVTVNRTGTGGSHPWMNSLTSTDTLGVLFEYSLDSGATWNGLGTDEIHGGSTVVKGVTVPQTTGFSVGIGVQFPTGTRFRVTLTASTPLTFNGSATYS